MSRARAAALAWLLIAPFGAQAREPIDAQARKPVEIAVLTYNIHGLPSWIAGDDPPARIPLILKRTTGYDIVLLQEDFAYHDVVLANAAHPHVFRGNEGWAPFLSGAGLTILSHLPVAAPPLAAAYGVCNGYLGAANDCFANKGFLMARLALPDGAELDVWNTHLDAGGSDEDRAARRAQLDRLATAIEAHSNGRALLVGGDFNLEWDDPLDRALAESFRDRLGLAIAAQTPSAGWESHLDYLLLRSGSDARLLGIGGGKDDGMVGNASAALSDHPAIFLRVRVE